MGPSRLRHDDDEEALFAKATHYPAPWFLWFSALVVGVNALGLGYDVGCMNDALGLIKRDFDLSDLQEEIIDGTLNAFAALGALFGSEFTDGPLGRRGSIALSAFLYLIGVVITTAAWRWYQLMIGRSISGLGVGLSFCCGSLYLSEISPSHLRGKVCGLFDLFIDLGIVIGSIV